MPADVTERSTAKPGRQAPRALFAVSLCAVALSATVLDQMTKWIAASALTPNEPMAVIPGLLSFKLRANPHGAFGLFSGLPDGLRMPVLLALAVLAMTAVTVYSIRTLGRSRTVGVALGLVLGGAVANQADRLLRGQVVDFIHLHWSDRLHWPTFNVADMSITIGSLLLAATVFRLWRIRPKAEEAADPDYFPPPARGLKEEDR